MPPDGMPVLLSRTSTCSNRQRRYHYCRLWYLRQDVLSENVHSLALYVDSVLYLLASALIAMTFLNVSLGPHGLHSGEDISRAIATPSATSHPPRAVRRSFLTLDRFRFRV